MPTGTVQVLTINMGSMTERCARTVARLVVAARRSERRTCPSVSSGDGAVRRVTAASARLA
jgi:hypothetical protein